MIVENLVVTRLLLRAVLLSLLTFFAFSYYCENYCCFYLLVAFSIVGFVKEYIRFKLESLLLVLFTVLLNLGLFIVDFF
jgi:hypothetical protein